jgi:hypothetical protein
VSGQAAGKLANRSGLDCEMSSSSGEDSPSCDEPGLRRLAQLDNHPFWIGNFFAPAEIFGKPMLTGFVAI